MNSLRTQERPNYEPAALTSRAKGGGSRSRHYLLLALPYKTGYRYKNVISLFPRTLFSNFKRPPNVELIILSTKLFLLKGLGKEASKSVHPGESGEFKT